MMYLIDLCVQLGNQFKLGKCSAAAAQTNCFKEDNFNICKFFFFFGLFFFSGLLSFFPSPSDFDLGGETTISF
jgi:hypothetical protein